MKREKIIREITTILITVFLFGCGANLGFDGQTMDIWHEGIASTHVTTTPNGAKLTLANVDTGAGATMSTAYSPNVVHYVPLPNYGAHLIVSHPNYKTQTIRLNKSKKKIHIKLEPATEKKNLDSSHFALSKAFGVASNSPDLSYVLDEAQIPELINDALTKDVNYPPDKDFLDDEKSLPETPIAVVSIENSKYAPERKSRTAKIRITSTPEKASLYLNVYPIGTTSVEIPVHSGYHQISLQKDQYETWTKQITIKDKQKTHTNVDMVPTETAHAGVIGK